MDRIKHGGLENGIEVSLALGCVDNFEARVAINPYTTGPRLNFNIYSTLFFTWSSQFIFGQAMENNNNKTTGCGRSAQNLPGSVFFNYKNKNLLKMLVLSKMIFSHNESILSDRWRDKQ